MNDFTDAAALKRVVSVDDNPMIGEVVGMLLDASPGLAHVGHFLSDVGVMQAIEQHDVRLVVLDYEIPGTDTLALLRTIKLASPGCRVLMLSAHARPEIVEACRAAGASGFVIKDVGPSQVLDAMKKVASGQSLFHSSRVGTPSAWLTYLTGFLYGPGRADASPA